MNFNDFVQMLSRRRIEFRVRGLPLPTPNTVPSFSVIATTTLFTALLPLLSAIATGTAVAVVAGAVLCCHYRSRWTLSQASSILSYI